MNYLIPSSDLTGVLTIVFMLIGAHFFGDFVFQSEFMALGKNPRKPLPNTPFWWPLTAHSWVHAMLVLLVLGSLSAALVELVAHWLTDFAKCMGWFGSGKKAFTIDQLCHLAVLGVLIYWFIV